jgi:hypothetical protein
MASSGRNPDDYGGRVRVSPVCSICWEPMENANTKVMDCTHVFHEHCINHWIVTALIPNCPICKDVFRPN